MTPLVYLFLLLLLNKCSSYPNVSRITLFFSTFSHPEEPIKYELQDESPIHIIIFVATLMFLVIISIILCKICSRQYRTREELLSRSPSVSSLDRLVRERLQDPPPTYRESQSNLTIVPNEPPSYMDIMRSTDRCNIFTISKMNDLTNQNISTHSDNISLQSDPPDYATSEGITNPCFQISNQTSTTVTYENGALVNSTNERW